MAVATLGLILTLTCAACQGDGASPDSSAASGPTSSLDGDAQSDTVIPEIRSEADIAVGRAFPLDAYALTDIQLTLISQALNLLTSQCMTEQGFQLPARQTSETLPERNRLVSEFGVGILTEVQEYGYQIPPQYLGEKASADSGTVQYSEAMIDALLGPVQDRLAEPVIQVAGGEQDSGVSYAPQSCLRFAHEKLGIALERGAELSVGMGSAAVANLNVESRSRTQADPRVIQVTKDWSDCMAASGFNWPNPHEASSAGSSDDTALEIATATADVRCKYDTNYFGVLYGVTVDYQQRLIDADLAGLETLADGNQDMLDKANAVIQAG
ncbi:MAG: hypothetical protein LBK42_00845 [Propionibacteriaceae bacterium]|nr:hypothetical protein [Propionibacteriaceae bacterium]